MKVDELRKLREFGKSDYGTDQLAPADANLIATAYNALPALLDVAEAAQRIADFDPKPQEPADAAWMFQTFLRGVRDALARLEAVR